MSRPRIGGADLLRLLAAAPEDADRLLRVLGYTADESARTATVLERLSVREHVVATAGLPEPDDAPSVDTDVALAPLTCWQPIRFEPVERPEARIAAADDGPVLLPRWKSDPGRQPDPAPLADWRSLAPRLRRLLAEHADTRQPDVPALVHRLGRGRALRRLPRLRRRRWGRVLTLIEDRSLHLTPYWPDQSRVAEHLAALFPEQGLRHGLIWEGADRPEPFDPEQPADAVWPPPRGSLVVVLGDLGGLTPADAGARTRWQAIGTELADLGCTAVALSPLPVGLHDPRIRGLWHIQGWEAGAAPGGRASWTALNAAADRLLAALAFAIRVEPGLLRDLRLALGLPAAAEGLAWQPQAFASRSSVAGTLRADALPRLRERFAELDAATRRRALTQFHRWRGGLPAELWFAEIEALPQDLRAGLPHAGDADAADAYFAALGRRVQGLGGSETPAGLRTWYRLIAPRLRPDRLRDPALGVHFQRLERVAFGRRDGPVPAGYDPALDAVDAAGADTSGEPPPLKRLEIRQQGGELVIEPDIEGRVPASDVPGSVIGLLRSELGDLVVEPQAEPLEQHDPQRDPAFRESDHPPPWADARGRDAYGSWVEIVVAPETGDLVRQRLRWIEPGSFLMGSPETEPGRYDDEGPQHEVYIAQGYWLFDTPVTQALWQAVMGDNPGLFEGPDRPVENVSWNDVQRFLEALNARVPGLDLCLPSEAQWEYACRAKSSMRWCFGDDEEHLGEYAWYSRNAEGETHPVARKSANRWGLHDMHGNVEQWVQDAWHDRYKGAPDDGSPWESSKASADRVIRGGAWNGYAQDCRSAFRDGGGPDYRNDYLGFRCARAQVREPGSGQSGGEERSDRPRREAARGSVVGRISEAHPPQAASAPATGTTADATLRLGGPAPAAVALAPAAPALLLRSDREQLTLRRLHRPGWAEAIGRDRFGLWADIAVTPAQTTAAAEPVIQRLRWIPPGRFTMGSPQDEPGRRSQGEGPQHEVVIRQGFWLFDTPCTQALWEAVLGEHVSRFRDPQRPVESVTWDDAQRFARALDEHLAALGADGGRIVLPSEAQWEYACRAGTDTALYTGPIEIDGENNAPALDPIAWYFGNSGKEYDLDEAHETTRILSEEQYQIKGAGTRRVAQKQPNSWGLYDMLGNVLEWTEDHWHDSYQDAPADGGAWLDSSADGGAARVVRGGSWDNRARICRSAFRDELSSDFRDGGLGFRCARVQS